MNLWIAPKHRLSVTSVAVLLFRSYQKISNECAKFFYNISDTQTACSRDARISKLSGDQNSRSPAHHPMIYYNIALKKIFQ